PGAERGGPAAVLRLLRAPLPGPRARLEGSGGGHPRAGLVSVARVGRRRLRRHLVLFPPGGLSRVCPVVSRARGGWCRHGEALLSRPGLFPKAVPRQRVL